MQKSIGLLVLGLVFIGVGCTKNNNHYPARYPLKKEKRAQQTSSISPLTENQMKGTGSKHETLARIATLQRQGSWNLKSEKVKEFAPIVKRAAAKYNVPEDLVFGIIWVESRYNPKAVSCVGARGLMQLMPKTATYLASCIKWKGKHNSFDPEFNIIAGTYYIARLIKQFDGDLELALAAYNAGAGNIRKWMRNTGLPKVSIEYHTMVKTARVFFGGTLPKVPAGNSNQPSQNDNIALPTDADLDRLGLAILIAGLSDDKFGTERPDDATPFE